MICRNVFPLLKMFGGEMNNEKINNPDSTNNKSEQTYIKKKSLLDSLFVSNSIIISMGLIVIVTIFIMGSYVFTLHDREVQIAIKQSWIDSSETIIMTVQEQLNRLNELRDTIPRLEATKKNLLLEETTSQQTLHQIKNQVDEYRAQINTQNATINVLQSEIASAENKLATYNNDLPKLNQTIRILTGRQSSLQTSIDNKQLELNKLTGQISAGLTQLTEITKRLKSITSVDNDFNEVKRVLNNAANELSKIRSQFQSTNSDLQTQIVLFEKSNNMISESSASLNSSVQSIANSSNLIQTSNRKMSNILQDLKSDVDVLTTTIKTLENFEENARTSRDKITSRSNNVITEIDSLTRSLKDILNRLSKIQTQLNDVEKQTN